MTQNSLFLFLNSTTKESAVLSIIMEDRSKLITDLVEGNIFIFKNDSAYSLRDEETKIINCKTARSAITTMAFIFQN